MSFLITLEGRMLHEGPQKMLRTGSRKYFTISFPDRCGPWLTAIWKVPRRPIRVHWLNYHRKQ